MKSDSLVIIPTYNEKENISNIINAVLGVTEHQFDVLIVDDNSPDGTAAIVESMMPQWPERLHLLKRAGKQGLGTAYIEGFKWALAHTYEYVTEMDADFSHPVGKLHELQAACATGGADVAVGSRYISGVNVVNWPMGRMLMSYYASAYVRLVTGMQVLRLPDRDEVYGPLYGLQDQGGAHRVCQSRAGHEQDEQQHLL